MSTRLATAPAAWGVGFPDAPTVVPWQQFLDEVVEAGYEWIEAGPYGYLPTQKSRLREELDSRGLKLIATHAMSGHLDESADWPKTEQAMLAAGELGAAMGATLFVLIDDTYVDHKTGLPTMPAGIDDSGWKRFIDTTHRVAENARDRFGVQLVFHPHAETHLEHEPQIEAFLEDTDPGLVSLLLDTGHHAYCGGDPVKFMRKHHDRIAYLHLKDVDEDLLNKARGEHMTLLAATDVGVFCEPTAGMVDFEGLSDLLHEIEYDGWATVEHDMYSPPLDKPLPIAKRTAAYFRGIGIG